MECGIPCQGEDQEDATGGGGGGNKADTLQAKILSIQQRNDTYQTSGKDCLIRISVSLGWVLQGILGMNEQYQRKNDEGG